MIIEQTIEIQADHRLVLELPLELPLGKARLEVTVTPTPAPSPAQEEPKLGMLTPEQLKTVIGDKAPAGLSLETPVPIHICHTLMRCVPMRPVNPLQKLVMSFAVSCWKPPRRSRA
jgi:hypothetical protein